MSAEYLYYAMVFGLALTAAPFNRVALVVLAVWVFGQIAWLLHLPMASSYIVIHAVAFAIGCAVSRNPICALVTALFVPILAVDLAEILGWASPYHAWWARVYLGSAQLLLLWPAVKFDLLLRAYKRAQSHGPTHVERVVA